MTDRMTSNSGSKNGPKSNSKIDLVINSRERDIGGFSVRRLLPYATHRMVGPFIFFDHMGPAEFTPGHGLDVRPHPHINLATVTYLFEGQIRHRDSLGSDRVIEPGAVNWMTAGRGIVHSERTTDEARANGSRVNGIQLWVALPTEAEECEPSFAHHPRNSFPEFEVAGVQMRVLLGEAFSKKSPVSVSSPLFYVEARMPKGTRLTVPGQNQEAAFYLVKGRLRAEATEFEGQTMVVLKSGHELQPKSHTDSGDARQGVVPDPSGVTPSGTIQDGLEIEALEDSHVMLLGGAPVGPRFIYWNFVSSSQARLEEVKCDWELGPRPESARFHPIPGDQSEFIPLPEEPMRAADPKSTPL